MDAKEFGSFIAGERKAKGLTQKQLADTLKVTDKAVSRWENGHGYPDIETLEDLSDALGLSLMELMHSKRLTEEEQSVTLEDASKTISDTTEVWFKPLTDAEISWYVDTYKPFDKAGAYAIQEWIGYIGISRIDGSYFNVVGFPVHRVYELLREFGV